MYNLGNWAHATFVLNVSYNRLTEETHLDSDAEFDKYTYVYVYIFMKWCNALWSPKWYHTYDSIC